MPWDPDREDYINKYNYMRIWDITATDLYNESVTMIQGLSPEEIALVVSDIYWAEKISKEKGLVLHNEDADVVRIAAIHHCDDQHVFADAIIVEWSSHFIGEAMEHMTDQELLLKIVENAKSSVARKMAARRITSQEQHIHFATEPAEPNRKNDYRKYRFDHEVRMASVYIIQDQEVLKKIFLTDDVRDVRTSALSRITDEDFLYVYAMQEPKDPDHPEWDGDVRRAAVSQINNQTRLVTIAKHDRDPEVQVTAIRKIQDQAVLVDFALQSQNTMVIRNALGNIKDQQILMDLARQQAPGNSYFFREYLIDAITDLDTLSYMAEHDNEIRDREHAAYRLKELVNLSD